MSRVKPGPPRMHGAGVGFHAVAQRVEVERLQGAIRFHLIAVMGDQQGAVDEPDVGLDRAEPVVQGVEERALVFVVVVGMGAWEREWARPRRAARRRARPAWTRAATAATATVSANRRRRNIRGIHEVFSSRHPDAQADVFRGGGGERSGRPPRLDHGVVRARVIRWRARRATLPECQSVRLVLVSDGVGDREAAGLAKVIER
jgi:hypothetical protein